MTRPVPADVVPELIRQLNASTLVADELATRLDSLQEQMQAENARLARDAEDREDTLRGEADARDAKQRRRLLTVLAALVAVVVLLGLLTWGYLRQQSIIDDQQIQADTQKCLNHANDVRAQTAQAFYEREVKKLYLQADGFQKLLDSSTAKNQPGALAGFKEFLDATKNAADGNAQVLRQLGVKAEVGKDAQGDVTVRFTELPTAPASVSC